MVKASFLEDPFGFFRIWEGGLVFYGGLLVAVAGLLIYTKIKEIPPFLIGDAFAVPLLLSQAIGRLGCFAAGCCYGRPTDSFLGVTFTHPESLAPLHVALHPTQLYSAGGLFILFLIGWRLSRRALPNGALMVYYLISYGLFRFGIEFVRNDFRGAFAAHLSPSQWVSLGLIMAGLGLWVYVKKNIQEK